MIIVVGCGVAGLSCAVLLAEAGHAVEIWAASLPPRTTSNVAAAFWYPYQVGPRERVLGWARSSYRHFGQLVGHPEAGVRMHRVLDLRREPEPEPWLAEIVTNHGRLAPEERPPGFAGGFRFEAPVIDTRRYLPYLQRRFERAGGQIRERRLHSLDQALAEHPVVVNCTGLGARALASDPAVFPIRGQLVHVRNPGIERVLLDEHGDDGVAYVVPRGDHCVLGSTLEPHVDDRELRPQQTAEIVERCARLDPRLSAAARQAELVGLRPGRPTVRLEAEPRGDGLVVHNYGHGGAGVTLSWGCAEDAVRLATPRRAPVAASRPA